MEDFTSASRRTLSFLHKQFGFGLWMVTRVENDNWVILSAEDQTYGVQAGDVFKWSESLCSHMVSGAGPNFAMDALGIKAYREAPIAQQVVIGAYVGIPIRQADGSLFGTLCAVSPEKQPAELEKQLEFVRMAADLLSCVLNSELKAVAALRRLEREAESARIDDLTSLYNRRGWINFLKVEEDRCRRYGHPACIVSIDLDDLKQTNDRQGHARGDELLQASAAAALSAVRVNDVVARLGGDEFGVLCVECDEQEANAILSRMRDAFAAQNINASFGLAMRRPDLKLPAAAEAADQSMYREKRVKKSVLIKRTGTYG